MNIPRYLISFTHEMAVFLVTYITSVTLRRAVIVLMLLRFLDI